jgi:acyl-homoserine-lactone acylase
VGAPRQSYCRGAFAVTAMRAVALVALALAALVAALASVDGPAAPAAALAQSDGDARAGARTVESAARERPRRRQRLSAEVSRTTYGVPHVVADDFRSLGFGFSHAFAEDNLCTIADSYVTVAGQRSRFFGPDESWTFSGNGTVNNNLLSDFYHRRINESGFIEDLVASPAPQGPLPKVEKLVEGYVAGYNRYLRETGVDNLPDPRCRGADWVRPIDEIDVYRRFYQLGSLASSGAAIGGIGGAEPLVGADAASAAAEQRSTFSDPAGSFDELLPIGSNAYGFGSEATDNGRGMVLGNPHFPWDGAERLYQTHLRIPGRFEAAGATLYGVPLILIGHTDGLAWSHTVASAWRFTPFELTLEPGDPYSYLVDGRYKEMEETRVTVRALTDDGDLERRSRTLYETDYGPMLTELAGLPFPWTPARGFALRDVNRGNFRYLNHFLKTNLAQSVREYDRIQRNQQGIPWVNNIAADSRGEAYYSMDGAVPNVPDEKALQCNTALGTALFQATGIPVLDGARSSCDWDDDPDAAAPGIMPPSDLPRLFRRDYVHNGNDSHWLSNPEQPLEGFDRIVGDERTTRSLRTRLGLVMVEDRLSSGRDFSLRALQRVALGNRQYAGELWRDELVEFCRSNPPADGGQQVCDVLAEWNVRDDLDSNGAILFRRFASNLLGNFTSVPTGTSAGQQPGSETVFDEQFDANDPVHTPSGLRTENPLVGQALDDAVADLRGAGIPLDAPLGDFQSERRGGQRIPIHGGPGGLGVFNAINVSFDSERGYPNVPHGSSFLTAMQFTDGPCPVEARTFVTYGQSENPESPNATDYTRAFSEKDWHSVPYCRAEIRRDPELEVEEIATTIPVDGRRPGGGGDPGGGGEPSDGRSTPGGGESEGGSVSGTGGGAAPASSAEDAATVGAAVGSRDRGDGGSLPFTGLAVGALALVGVALGGAGALLRRRARPTR